MNILYNISIQVFVIGIYISSLFNTKAKLWINGRKHIFKQLSEAIKDVQNVVWFHCASLGEFEQGKPIIETYKKKYPKHKILLTFFSPSGYEIRKNYKGADWVFYLPADTKRNTKQFLSIVNPIKAVFIKSELWINYISELKKQNIPCYSVSSIFRKQQVFFKYQWALKKLQYVTHFFVQDQNSKRLLKNIGCSNCTIAGDTRFDSVIANARNATRIPLIETFSKSKPTIICGSTWPKDEILLAQYIKNHPENNYIIAPHELHYIFDLQKKTNALLYSKANEKNILMDNNVLIIDTIGILSNIYQYGQIAYIGGGLGSEIHNILEAVTFGLPVIFGFNYQKSNEAKELINQEAAISISNYNELTSAIQRFNTFDSKISTNYIKRHCGATSKVLNHI